METDIEKALHLIRAVIQGTILGVIIACGLFVILDEAAERHLRAELRTECTKEFESQLPKELHEKFNLAIAQRCRTVIP